MAKLYPLPAHLRWSPPPLDPAGERKRANNRRYYERSKSAGHTKYKTPSAKAKHAQQQADRARATRERISVLKAHPCEDCWGSFPTECMDFDHRPGEQKLFNVASYMHLPWERVVAEIAKCDLVCANCHRIRTKERKHVA